MNVRSTDIFAELNPPQREAVKHAVGPLLVLAGAGSGKTRVLACRAAQLVQSGHAAPHQILALTFTNKAARELKSRAESVLPAAGSYPFAGTFHSIFARLMRIEGLNIGVNPDFIIIDADDRRRMIQALLKESNLPSHDATPSEVEWAVSRAKSAVEDPMGFFASAARESNFKWSRIFAIAGDVYPLYEKRLRLMNGMDFDDLLIKPLLAFSRYPGFLERLRSRFRYVLVDEFQDTNIVQYRLVSEIAREHRNLCVVGDDDQAIYGWRGASVENILEFKRDWNDATVIRLEQNFRSLKPILDVAWSVISKNPRRHAKKLWTDRDGGQRAELIWVETADEEAMKFTGIIDVEHHSGGREYNDFAILYRTNAQSLAFERALRSARIPYHVIGGLRFYERREIKDVLAYLRVLVNPADDVSLQRIINYPPRGIGEGLLAELGSRARVEGITLSAAISAILGEDEIAMRRRSALQGFVTLMDGFRKRLGEVGYDKLARDIVKNIALRERLAGEEKTDPSRAESKTANLEMLLDDISRYRAENPQRTLPDFLEEVALVTDADEFDEKPDRVNLLTVHTAKGLEFPVVFIGGVEEGLLPLAPRDGMQNIEEERRLFYVGVTRAMERLILGCANYRQIWGGFRGGPSSFLHDIPSELLVINRPQARATGGCIRSSRMNSRIEAHPSVKQRRVEEPLSGVAADPDELHSGLLVRHPKFGLGMVVSVQRMGLDSRVQVDFDDVGDKTLVLKYARLEIQR